MAARIDDFAALAQPGASVMHGWPAPGPPE
jgi:hypothetical protein